MDKKSVITATLAEWGMTLTESEIDQLVPAYDNLLRWQEVVHGMLCWQGVSDLLRTKKRVTIGPEGGRGEGRGSREVSALSEGSCGEVGQGE